jgi:hypothetical protein
VTLVKNNEIEIFTLKGEPARDEFLAAWRTWRIARARGPASGGL